MIAVTQQQKAQGLESTACTAWDEPLRLLVSSSTAGVPCGAPTTLPHHSAPRTARRCATPIPTLTSLSS